MIRVAVQGWLPSDQPSGARTRLRGLLRGLARIRSEGFEVTLLTSASGAADPDLVAAVRALPRGRVQPVPIPTGPTWRRALAEARALPDLLERAGFDLLDLQSLPVPSLLVPVALTIHDLRDLGPLARGLRRLAAPAVLRTAVRRAARVLVPSPTVADELRRRHPALAGRIDVVPAGVPALPVAAAPRDLPSPAFVHVGRPERRKALPFLLEAYARAVGREPALPPLVLVGPCPPRAGRRLAGQAARWGLTGRVHLAGVLTDGELAAVLRGATALVFPSRLEGFGLPVLEAMACGLPCLVAAGGAPAWLAGEAGLALSPRVEEWATAMVRVVTDASLHARLARAAEGRAATFGEEAAARAWRAAWTRAIPALEWTSP